MKGHRSKEKGEKEEDYFISSPPSGCKRDTILLNQILVAVEMVDNFPKADVPDYWANTNFKTLTHRTENHR